jgi:hypothetical protein
MESTRPPTPENIDRYDNPMYRYDILFEHFNPMHKDTIIDDNDTNNNETWKEVESRPPSPVLREGSLNAHKVEVVDPNDGNHSDVKHTSTNNLKTTVDTLDQEVSPFSGHQIKAIDTHEQQTPLQKTGYDVNTRWPLGSSDEEVLSVNMNLKEAVDVQTAKQSLTSSDLPTVNIHDVLEPLLNAHYLDTKELTRKSEEIQKIIVSNGFIDSENNQKQDGQNEESTDSLNKAVELLKQGTDYATKMHDAIENPAKFSKTYLKNPTPLLYENKKAEFQSFLLLRLENAQKNLGHFVKLADLIVKNTENIIQWEKYAEKPALTTEAKTYYEQVIEAARESIQSAVLYGENLLGNESTPGNARRARLSRAIAEKNFLLVDWHSKNELKRQNPLDQEWGLTVSDIKYRTPTELFVLTKEVNYLKKAVEIDHQLDSLSADQTKTKELLTQLQEYYYHQGSSGFNLVLWELRKKVEESYQEAIEACSLPQQTADDTIYQNALIKKAKATKLMIERVTQLIENKKYVAKAKYMPVHHCAIEPKNNKDPLYEQYQEEILNWQQVIDRFPSPFTDHYDTSDLKSKNFYETRRNATVEEARVAENLSRLLEKLEDSTITESEKIKINNRINIEQKIMKFIYHKDFSRNLGGITSKSHKPHIENAEKIMNDYNQFMEEQNNARAQNPIDGLE